MSEFATTGTPGNRGPTCGGTAITPSHAWHIHTRRG